MLNMKKYSVTTGSETFDTDSLEEAKSVLESMASQAGTAILIDNETDKILDEY